MVNACARQSICLWIKGHKAVCSIVTYGASWVDIQFNLEVSNLWKAIKTNFDGFLKLCKRYFDNRTFCHKSLLSSKNICQFLKNLLPNFVIIAYNMKGCLRFPTSIFWYHQIWLNMLMNDHHLRNIPKLGEGKKITFSYHP